jgi:hypothetical protein
MGTGGVIRTVFRANSPIWGRPAACSPAYQTPTVRQDDGRPARSPGAVALMLMASHRSVVWNYRQLDGLTARAVIDLGESTVTLSLFLGDELQDIEEFANSRDAMRRAEELRLLVTHRGRRGGRAS